ncbi:MAG: class I SAM-dependent methyltransferase [Bacteroidota bacterium]
MGKADKIIESWFANADNWIAVIDNAEIESRKLCTNQAVIQSILSYPVNTILDIGCGEGWLAGTLRSYGKLSYGVDVVPALIENAIQKDGNFYQLASYASLAKGIQLAIGSFDAAVMNFSLLDKNDSENLLKSLRRYVTTDGFVFIQTLHTAAIEDNERSGWREGSWNGFKRAFIKPYNWYFRTLADWYSLFAEAGLKVIEIKEPLHPATQKPLSFIFVLQLQTPG